MKEHAKQQKRTNHRRKTVMKNS